MGHELGLSDLTSSAAVHDLMFIDLVDGERRLPDATDVAQADAMQALLSGANVALQAQAALPASAQASAGGLIIVGTAGNDTIDAGSGGNILVGLGGADSFVFTNAAIGGAQPLTHVADYHFAEGDRFDFTALTSAFHGSAADDGAIVRAIEDPSGTFATLQVNTANPDWGNKLGPVWTNVAQIDGMHPGDAVSVLVDNHAVHLAQIHAQLL